MSPAAERERRIFLVLQVAAAMCFVGHGAFGVLTKAAWGALLRGLRNRA
jgi:hypothetical protein